MRNVVILGSTGSIGQSTLSVIQHNADDYHVYALVANQNVMKMVEQCEQFLPVFAVMQDTPSAEKLQAILKEKKLSTRVLSGMSSICDIVTDDNVDIIMAAIVGAAGVKPTLAAVMAKKTILLANKETLVTCGGLFMRAIQQYGATLLPVDSEHNAIFQCLPESMQSHLGSGSLTDYGIHSVILTGSGGPFRQLPLADFPYITVEQACAHPNWSMGRKISVDSATMMNKGLEYIEARWLFNASAEQMEIVLHPQSVIHSMVRFMDGSVIAQLGEPDMRTPIANAMAYPQRISSGAKALDFTKIKALTFELPETERYPCLYLAIEAFKIGQAATTALNAANEVAVDAFLQQKIAFSHIAKVNAEVLALLNLPEPSQIEDVLLIDEWARGCADQVVHKL